MSVQAAVVMMFFPAIEILSYFFRDYCIQLSDIQCPLNDYVIYFTYYLPTRNPKDILYISGNL